MTWKKPLKIIFAVVGTILLLLVLDILFILGPTLKLAAEKIGSKALGTPLTIERLSIKPLKGTVQLTGFSIANHDTFNRSNTVSLASMDLSIDMGSLFSETVAVHRVAINSPHFIYEQNPETDNVTEFIRNIEAFAGIEPGMSKQTELIEEKKAGKQPKPVVIESLEINDLQLHLANTDDARLDINAGFDRLTVSMTNGIAELRNLHVSNPGRLMTTNLFELEEIRAELDPESFYSDRLSIRDIQVIRPYVYLEQNSDTDTAAEFLHIASRLTSRVSAAEPVPEAETVIVQKQQITDDASAAPPGIELHNLFIDDIQLILVTTAGNAAPPEMHMLAGIGSVSLKLVDGTAQVRDITIPNPEGFAAADLFHLTGIDISMDPESIFSDQVSIQRILIHSPEIHLEQTDTSGNAAELQASLTRFVPPVKKTKEPEPEDVLETVPEPAPIPLAEQPVVLHALLVTNFSINLTLPPPSTNQTSAGLQKIANLNPVGKVSLERLNPLNMGGGSRTNTQEVVENGPLKMISFDLLSIEPLKGLVRIDNLQVANPPGFANKNLVDLSTLSIDLDPDSLQSDTLFIRDVLIDRPRFTYERKLMTDNIKALQKEIEKVTASQEEIKPQSAEEPEPAQDTVMTEAGEGKKVVIEHLLAKDGSVKAKLSVIPSTPSIPLPDIEISDLGKSDDGKAGADVASVLTSISDTFYDTIIGTVSSATGFGMDALKSVGALLPAGSSTNGVTNATVSAESELPEEETIEPNVPYEEKRVLKKPAQETKKRRRIFFHKRRWML